MTMLLGTRRSHGAGLALMWMSSQRGGRPPMQGQGAGPVAPPLLPLLPHPLLRSGQGLALSSTSSLDQ